MADSRRERYDGRVVDVASVAEFVKGYQQQGLKKALVFAAPFAVDRMLFGSRKRSR